MELGREDVLERVAQDEDGDRDAQQRDDRDQAVTPALRVSRGPATQRDADPDGQGHGPDGQLDGRGESREQLVDHAPVVDDALAEVALQQLAEVDEVLLVQGLVETHAGHDLGGQRRRRVLAEQRLDRVARDQVDDREDEDGQPEQDGDRADETSGDVLQHSVGRLVPGDTASPGPEAPGMLRRITR